MTKFFVFAAYGWLTFAGLAHLAIDVVSQHVLGIHAPGRETTLPYGLHFAYALARGSSSACSGFGSHRGY
jgi:hypothetical protein